MRRTYDVSTLYCERSTFFCLNFLRSSSSSSSHTAQLLQIKNHIHAQISLFFSDRATEKNRMVQDPWSIHDSNYSSSSSATPSPNSDVPNEPSHLLSFEDNFHPSSSSAVLLTTTTTTTNTKLPDTEEYLQSLGKQQSVSVQCPD